MHRKTGALVAATAIWSEACREQRRIRRAARLCGRRRIGCRGRLHRRCVVEQLPAAALGGARQAEHPEDGRGRGRQVHRCRRQPEQRAAGDRHRHDDLEGRQGPDRAGAGHEGWSCRRWRRPRRRASRSSRYDRLIEDPSALYITFDNTGVGKAEADAIIKKVPKGNYVLIKGDPGDPNAKTFLPAGWDQAGLKDKVASGDIKIIGPADGTYTDAWKTEKAQSNMEAIIDSAVSSRHEDRRDPGRERQHGARRRRRPHGQELRLPAPQRPGRRHRQPEQRRAGQAVRRHLEERQRAGQGRRLRQRSRCATAAPWPASSSRTA